MLRIIRPGLQTTLQGSPRIGARQFGIPYSGPADAVSMALANHLVGNPQNETCLEITYGNFTASIEDDCALAITGAVGEIMVSGQLMAAHHTLTLRRGDALEISPPQDGARAYLAIRSGFRANFEFGSTSTYLPAGFGGHDGRALIAEDILAACGDARFEAKLQTPQSVRPAFTGSFALRACTTAETSLLAPQSLISLFSNTFTAGRQGTRMGVSLTGQRLDLNSDGMMKSAPVFPGTIQCPSSGEPILLLCDAQTTGGYPRIASIARCDRHLLGQIRPGNSIRLLQRSPEAAAQDHAEKQQLLDDWLGPPDQTGIGCLY